MMQELKALSEKLGLTGIQKAKLLFISPTLLSHAEKGRRNLNALSKGYLDQGFRILLGLPPMENQASKPEISTEKKEKELKRIKLELDKAKKNLEDIRAKLAQIQNKKEFARRLLEDQEPGPRPTSTLCRNWMAEAEAELAVFSPFLQAQKEARIKALEAEKTYWMKLQSD